ncbi:MAG: M20 metallopeptidase family protein [Planctomycetota bacterium]
MPDPVIGLLQDLLPRLRGVRQDLHRHPELGFEEHRTQGIVTAWLEELGYVPRACAGTGGVADLRPGAPGPVIALRADMDALPIHEDTDLPYRSVHEGVAHKCGHDGHTTVMLGVAAALATRRDSLPHGNVRLLFQPAEEGVRGGGARVMVEEGALEGVAEVYGHHNWPNFPRGEVRVAAGPVMAQEATFRITLKGWGGHASQPQVTRDPLTAGAQLVTALNGIAARGIGHHGGAVLSVTSFQCGTTRNVIPGRGVLLGTVRALDEALGERIVARIRDVAAGIAAAHLVEAEVEIGRGFPVLPNDASCVEAVRAAAADIVGPDAVSGAGLPLAASEDFAYFARAVPGAYFFMGAGRVEGETPGCHHPDFDYDDELIVPTARIFVRLAEARLAAWAGHG